MKKSKLILVCLFAIMAISLSVKAQEITITIRPGWNWISCPGTEAVDLATAMGSFIPKEGDMIKSQDGTVKYLNGRWKGNISKFYPGYGYKYNSTRTVPVTLTFNAQQSTSQVAVATSEPMLITGNSAMCGGNVTVNDGTYILVRGLCWATHENPMTNGDFFLELGNGVGSFAGSMTGLNISTTYYVRAYVVTANGTVYGEQKSFTTEDGIPLLTTTNAINIGSSWASCGGNVTEDYGLSIIARGVCWSTRPNPTIANSHTSDGTGMGNFTSYITGLNVSTTYYVRAYATTSAGTGYGEQKSFTTYDNPTQAWVDLGLPSGLLWATCNVGADNPEDYGDYFAWGETELKHYYAWITYQYCHGTYTSLTKYCHRISYGYNGYTDNLITLEPCDDVAAIYWGEGRRIPTKQEWQELLQNTTNTWITQNGVSGRLFTASNGNSIFLPAAGYCDASNHFGVGSDGLYWSSSLNTNFPCLAWYASIKSDNSSVSDFYRGDGQSIRPVRSASSMTNLPTVMTSQVTNVTQTTATGGGNVTDNGGATVTERGICWSTNHSPNVSDSHASSGTGTGSYTCTMTNLTANTTYYVRAYAKNNAGTVYGSEISFTTGNGSGSHNFVDLGLPSGLLWATCNVGADAPEDYGDYFAWGETQPKDFYNWSTYQHCNGSSSTLTKYCNKISYGYNGYTDNKTILEPVDDAATANWGGDWRMPTEEEWEELLQYTTSTWTTLNGVNGYLLTASNGNNIFLPASGFLWGGSLRFAGYYGKYWSSSLSLNYPYHALGLHSDSGDCSVNSTSRGNGQSVRAVRVGSQN